jgi:hypothetical protein
MISFSSFMLEALVSVDTMNMTLSTAPHEEPLFLPLILCFLEFLGVF